MNVAVNRADTWNLVSLRPQTKDYNRSFPSPDDALNKQEVHALHTDANISTSIDLSPTLLSTGIM